jgi:hypothetical protein
LKFDTSFSARISAANDVLRNFLDTPLLGNGITGFWFIDGQYFRNLIETGILGSLAFFWVLFTIHKLLRNALKVLSDDMRFQGMILGLYAGFWGLMVHALSANTFIIIKICEPFWCLMGFITVAVILKQEKGKQVESDIVPSELRFEYKSLPGAVKV